MAIIINSDEVQFVIRPIKENATLNKDWEISNKEEPTEEYQHFPQVEPVCKDCEKDVANGCNAKYKGYRTCRGKQG